MFTVQFNFNLCYIVYQKGNRYSKSMLKDLRKLIDLPRATAKNVYLINIPQNYLSIFFLYLCLSQPATPFQSVFFLLYSFIYQLVYT